ncbi:MAG: Flp pilus assembly protein CpaB [Planctomycetota bacterium]|nr:Flp pilus assembly protein CpaB [Planctomycetota bacterium]
MNVKKFAPLILAILMGLIAWMVAAHLSSKRQADATSGAKRPQIMVAKAPIDAGESITEEKLTIGTIDADVLPDSVFKTPGEVIGRVATVPMLQGQAITSTLLAPKGMGAGLQAVVPLGMRAITLEINEFSGIAGFVTPGCHVDILQTLRDEKTGNPIARTIVQNVQVTEVGVRHNPVDNNNAPDNGGGRSVTLLVTPDQAEILELASMNGRPRLSLRGGNDLAPISTHGVTLTELIGDKTTGDAAVARMPLPTTEPIVPSMASSTTRPVDNDQWTMQIVRGSTETDVHFTLPRSETEAGDQLNNQ